MPASLAGLIVWLNDSIPGVAESLGSFSLVLQVNNGDTLCIQILQYMKQSLQLNQELSSLPLLKVNPPFSGLNSKLANRLLIGLES